MKKLLSTLLMLILLLCALVGCSGSDIGISQEDYDNILAENKALKEEIDTLKNELKEAQEKKQEPQKEPDAPAPSSGSDSNSSKPSNDVGSRKNPLKIGDTFDGVYTEYDDYKYGMSITLLEVISGEEAWSLIKAKNQFNDPPGEGMQYIMARFSITYHTDMTGDDRPLKLGSYKFSYSTSNYKIEDLPSVVEPDPAFDIELYEGATGDGWVVFHAAADEESPKAVFLDSLWFDLK